MNAEIAPGIGKVRVTFNGVGARKNEENAGFFNVSWAKIIVFKI
jgi:hypothetical protein